LAVKEEHRGWWERTDRNSL